MKQPAARLVTVLFLALALRAADAQQYGPSPGQRGDPYAPAPGATPTSPRDLQRYPISVPQPQFRFGTSSGPTAASAPPAGDSNLRYPLPGQPGAPAAQPGAAPLPAPTANAAGPPVAQPLPAAQQLPAAPAAAGDLFQPAQIVATVGDKYIFYGDVAPIVNQTLEPALAKARFDSERQEIEKYREPLTRQTIRQMVESKLMYVEFERELEKKVPKDKLDEVRKNISKNVAETFEKDLTDMRAKVAQAKPEQINELLKRDPIIPRLAVLMRDHSAESLGELDTVLRRYGSTLEKQIRYYGEYKLGRSSVGNHVNFKPEVTHQEMLDYYREKADQYAVPAKARFEILTARFSNYPTAADAENAVAVMGNEVFFGAPFAAVAQRSSQEPNAQGGGYYDWTSQGSLASAPIDQAIFSLEVGKLSQIIKDDRGCHIVRVIERQPAGQVSFVEAQKSIKEAIIAQKREADYKKFVALLSTSTKVWTIYDEAEPTVTARQPDQNPQR